MAEDWPQPSRVFLKGGHPGKHAACIMFVAGETKKPGNDPTCQVFLPSEFKNVKINNRHGCKERRREVSQGPHEFIFSNN